MKKIDLNNINKIYEDIAYMNESFDPALTHYHLISAAKKLMSNGLNDVDIYKMLINKYNCTHTNAVKALQYAKENYK